jgi:hypothetical protein
LPTGSRYRQAKFVYQREHQLCPQRRYRLPSIATSKPFCRNAMFAAAVADDVFGR